MGDLASFADVNRHNKVSLTSKSPTQKFLFWSMQSNIDSVGRKTLTTRFVICEILTIVLG